VFVLDKPIEPNLMFPYKAGAFLEVALVANIRLGWKGLVGSYNLAYCECFKITSIESSIALCLGLNVIQLFRSIIF
jgi:hypothetical protein